MGEYKRYVSRTEAWAQQLDEAEDVIGSTGKVRAYPGDYVVNQTLRGENFTYVMSPDDFVQDWREPDKVDTSTATSDTGLDELPGTVPTDEEVSTAGDNPVSNAGQNAAVPTVGTPTENPSPADRPTGTDNADVPAPTGLASAPTGDGPGNDTQRRSSNPTETPDVGTDTADAMSPVSGVDTPDTAVTAPQGSDVGEASAQPETDDTTEEGTAVPSGTQTPQPDPTSPTQTDVPANTPGNTGAEDRGDVLTSPNNGGDAGNAPTPRVDNPDLVNTANDDGNAVTGDAPNDGKNTGTSTEHTETPREADNKPGSGDSESSGETKTPPRDPETGKFQAVKATDSDGKARTLPPVGDSLETEGKPQ